MNLSDLGTLLDKMLLGSALLLLLLPYGLAHLQYQPTNYLTSYELAPPNYNSTRSLLHVSHSLPGRSSISITRGSSSQISLPSREEINRGVFSSHERQLAHQSEPLPSISSGSFPSPSTSGTVPPHQSSEAIHELSSPHQPSVALTTNNHLETEEEIPGPFAPRFQVGRWEAGDQEWKAEIERGFQGSGLVPEHMPDYPSGLVNLNFGMHGCIHLGTQLPAQTVAYPPTRFSYPAQTDRLYTILLVDVDVLFLHWLVINIPGTSLADGQVIAEYQPPSPASQYPHRYLAVALLQEGVTDRQSLRSRSAYLCHEDNRRQFHLKSFLKKHKMELSAANYFLSSSYQPYVETVNQFCRDRRREVSKFI